MKCAKIIIHPRIEIYFGLQENYQMFGKNSQNFLLLYSQHTLMKFQ